MRACGVVQPRGRRTSVQKLRHWWHSDMTVIDFPTRTSKVQVELVGSDYYEVLVVCGQVSALWKSPSVFGQRRDSHLAQFDFCMYVSRALSRFVVNAALRSSFQCQLLSTLIFPTGLRRRTHYLFHFQIIREARPRLFFYLHEVHFVQAFDDDFVELCKSLHEPMLAISDPIRLPRVRVQDKH